MDLQAISSLMDQFEDSDIRELKIDDGDFHLYLSKNKVNKMRKSQAPVVENKEQASKTIAKSDNTEVESTSDIKDAAVKAPIVGIVYLQAKPGQPAFVKVGDHVEKGQTVCIIEAMKMMTEIKSTLTGTVIAINVENEDLVEVDQPLISVKED
ncbi:acetyl-CoA carboxylase biotin carboxyl carrier protein [Lactobacillus helveticus]|jgi:acetyl-CoA carboxylase biotin carboxyl carrier protein|uniref:acetyl-CoA carboxylase biotin carboxyl carrier protein n=1 Tax=Lactobacillus helveticus TaxID=1587 RepID=UPI000D7BDEC7|nr:acetyl-CoA carboxylase biotin carboxyl carrier protein [Lactobacillus helveticus]MBW7987226.1 acetyl-CoA carboxylase biotin carboxyl carrier protein [Lactobacillus helveticus]NRO50495.1 Biotin carboxyl carrier protein of acetyl-CoA carboxylase [Lactobacillus helveticus]NRO67827.1 Biotin carboxyl carrier protein of acetyl-CoA carboxylase [Lactobacillus helveticus]NRO69734.1 Biotin carboxyl carrier protein of acetyl-CoA carboxylase [Lactobacillus helveticus]PXZ21774.1 acetyl-CoA carboxylase b